MRAMSFLSSLLDDLDNPNKRKVIEFVFLWQDYNYYYNMKNPELVNKKNGKPLDALQAWALAGDKRAQDIYNKKLKNKFLTKFKAIPANNMGNWIRDRLLSTGEYQVEKPYNEDNDSLKCFLELVYQLRCNFIHGSKEGDVVDIELIAWARDCLGELLNKIRYFSWY